jgi:uncharacterized protein (TIGR03435 family)
MRNRETEIRSGWGNRVLSASGIAAQAALLFVGLIIAPRSRAQTPTGQPPAQSLEAMEAAGIKMSFDVASLKQNISGYPPSGDVPKSNIPLGLEISLRTSGDFSAVNLPLINYVAFAYKLSLYQALALQSQLPEWANDERFDIRARADGEPTTDQIRLMMQSLLAACFKLAAHHETRQLPTFALVLLEPRKIGPQLKPHLDNSCLDCGPSIGVGDDGILSFRKGTMDLLAMLLSNSGSVDRIVVDRTEMTGVFDVDLKFIPTVSEPNPFSGNAIEGFAPPVLPIPLVVTNNAPIPAGPQPSIFTALQEQLGLKLDPQTGPVDVLVIDHIEAPSPN